MEFAKGKLANVESDEPICRLEIEQLRPSRPDGQDVVSGNNQAEQEEPQQGQTDEGAGQLK